ncbi:MAG: hypothetical protein ABJL55_15310 [Roseibium sp.]
MEFFNATAETELLREVIRNVARPSGWSSILESVDSRLSCRTFFAEYLPDGIPSSRYGGFKSAATLADILSSITMQHNQSCFQFLRSEAELDFPYCKTSLSLCRDKSNLESQSVVDDHVLRDGLVSAPGLISLIRRNNGTTLLFACLFPGRSPNSIDIDEAITAFRKISEILKTGLETFDAFQDAVAAKSHREVVLEGVGSNAVLINSERQILAHTSRGLAALVDRDLAGLQNDVLIVRNRQLDTCLQDMVEFESNIIKDSFSNNLVDSRVTDFCQRNKNGELFRIIIESVGPEIPEADNHEGPLFLIYTLSPTETSDDVETLLQEEYGLSQSEAHLARLLTLVGSLVATGEKLGIKRNTAKTHLRRIFEKTGLHTQLELARLVHELSGLTPPKR